MFFRFCWNTPLGRVSRGFCDWLMCSILGFKELTDSSRSRSPTWRLLFFPPTHPPALVWCPCQVIEWLGIVWNTINETISISDRREISIASSVDKILSSDRLVSARGLASLAGKIISGGAVFGNISRVMTRYCSISVASAQDWDYKFYLDQYCVRELCFWQSYLKRLNCKVVADSLYKMSNYVVYSDASATGYGAHLDINGEQVCNKQWDLEESRKCSTWRELSAILFALHSFLPLLKGSYVKWFSDSQSACKIVQVGSMRSDLHDIAPEIFQFCAIYGIKLEVQWIPLTELVKADYISRIIDIDDWQISADCFRSLEESWGVHSVDCFASYYNKKVENFFSRFWNPGCSGVDFFVQNLEGENCLVVPPVSLIARAIHYLHVSRAVATLVVPFWPSSYFWPIISRKFSRFVVGYKCFEATALEQGQNINSFLGSDRFTGFILAVRMKFS